MTISSRYGAVELKQIMLRRRKSYIPCHAIPCDTIIAEGFLQGVPSRPATRLSLPLNRPSTRPPAFSNNTGPAKVRKFLKLSLFYPLLVLCYVGTKTICTVRLLLRRILLKDLTIVKELRFPR